jgi:CRP-like cAMP-binding protein
MRITRVSDFSRFAHDGKNEHVPAGQYFFRTGEHGDEMYVVLSGEVDIIVGDTLVETVAPGGIFGEMALIDHGQRSADVIAKSDADVAVIDAARFRALVASDPSFALEVMKIMADRLRRLDALL